MQPRQARRGTAAVAGSTLLLGVVLVILAFVLSACGGSSNGTATSSARASATAAASTTASGTPTPGAPSGPPAASTTPATSTPGTTAPASGAELTRPPVAVDQTATFTAGLTSTVISIEPISGTASLPGEIAGPAVRVTLAVQNGSGAALDLGNVTVDLQDAAAASATPLSGNGSAPFTGSLAPGQAATGVYVFSLATADRTGVTLYVTASASLPVVVFTGNLT